MNLNNASFITAFTLASIAAFGNALYAFGQKKAGLHTNPFLFGSLSLFAGAVLLFIVASCFKLSGASTYVAQNIKWIIASASGYVLLNIGLFFLYKNFGTAYYALYAVLAIISTSLLLPLLIFKEKLNIYFMAAFISGIITVVFFLKGKTLS